MRRTQIRLGSGKWNPHIFKAGQEYKAFDLQGYYSEYKEPVRDVTAHFLKGSTNNIAFNDIRHYWDNGYIASFYIVRTANFSGDLRGFTTDNSGAGTTYSPLELSFYNNGFYFDFHKPVSTSTNQTTGSTRNNDLEWRVMWYSLQNTITTNTIFRLDINATTHTLSLYDTSGTLKGSGNSLADGGSSFQSSYNFYNGLYTNKLFIVNYFAVGRIVFRDASGNIVHDYILTEDSEGSGNSRFYMKDYITNYSNTCMYTGTITEVKTQTFTPGTL